MSMIYEYIERTRMAVGFNQRDMRDRIRYHLDFIKGIESFPNKIERLGPLSALSDDELIAYDEYLNCFINLYFFEKYLRTSVRFSDAVL